MKPISIIVAIDEEFGIGKDGRIPWKGDFVHFRDTTTTTKDPNKKNAVIMGRNTFDSLPEKFRPLPERKNIVLSHSKQTSTQKVHFFQDIETALDALQKDDEIERIFIIGWASVYNYAFDTQIADEIILTCVPGKHQCDTFVDVQLDEYILTSDSILDVGTEKYVLLTYQKDTPEIL